MIFDSPSHDVVKTIIRDNKCSYWRIIKRDYREFFDYLIKISARSFPEKLYLYLNNYEKGTCKHCCGIVGFLEITTGYRQYCSIKCLNSSSDHKVATSDFFKDEQAVADRYVAAQKTYKKKYGVDHPMRDPVTKALASSKSAKALREKYRVEPFDGYTQKQYTRKARYITNTVYKDFQNLIDPTGIRSREFVLDHKFSIFEGYKNKIPLNIICHPSNLEIITLSENSSKHSACSMSIEELYSNIDGSIDYLFPDS